MCSSYDADDRLTKLTEANSGLPRDLAVRLEVPAAERFRRMAVRDGCPPDPDHPDNRRYLLGQELYERAGHSAGRADLLVDATQPEAPILQTRWAMPG